MKFRVHKHIAKTAVVLELLLQPVVVQKLRPVTTSHGTLAQYCAGDSFYGQIAC